MLYDGDKGIENYHYERKIVGFVVADCDQTIAVKRNFCPSNRQFTFRNDNLEDTYPLKYYLKPAVVT